MEEITKIFANRLKLALLKNNMRPVDLANKTGINKAQISSYMAGRYMPKQDGIYLISNALNVTPSWLMGYNTSSAKNSELENISKSSDLFPIPVYGQISAGQPNWAVECLEGYLPIDPNMMNILNPNECFFLRVNGESMNKLIKNGAYALIRKQDIVENGEIAVVLVNGFDATLKKFSKQNDLIILEPNSDDPSFTAQVYDKNTDIKILGKYIGKFEMNI